MDITLTDHWLAARLVAAAASDDPAQLRIVLHDIATNPNPGGVLPILLVLSDNVVSLARTLDPDDYLEQIRRGVADLTRRRDAQPPS